jgi:hypothetical protein
MQMHWARRIDFEDLLDGDAAAIYDEAGSDVLLAVLQHFSGHTLHLRSDVLEAIRRRYVRENPRGETAKEIAARLGVSVSYVRDASDPG